MITQTLCTAFKKNVLNGLEDFAALSPYVYKIALYDANADLGADTLVYTTTHEVVGTGYTAGGKILTPIPAVTSGTTAYISFQDVAWTSASFVTRGALIYNSTTGNAVAVLNFGSDKTASGTFPITFPPATATTAVIRFD